MFEQLHFIHLIHRLPIHLGHPCLQIRYCYIGRVTLKLSRRSQWPCFIIHSWFSHSSQASPSFHSHAPYWPPGNNYENPGSSKWRGETKPFAKFNPLILERPDRSINLLYLQGLCGNSPPVTLSLTQGAAVWKGMTAVWARSSVWPLGFLPQVLTLYIPSTGSFNGGLYPT